MKHIVEGRTHTIIWPPIVGPCAGDTAITTPEGTTVCGVCGHRVVEEEAP